MKTDNDLPLTIFENWTLRVRTGSGKRILLLLHGWTGDENSMALFARNLPSDYWVIIPRAPFKAASQGFSWRAPASNGDWPTLELFRTSVTALINLVDNWANTHNLEFSTFDVAGFSQGGAITCAIAAFYPDRIQKLGILAGFAPKGAEKVLRPGLLLGVKVFIAHGAMDEMVPLEMAHYARDLLNFAGASVTYCESQAGHKLSADCLRSFEAFLER